MVSYVTNLVELIGLGLAVDYSLLVVYRFREELGAARDVDDAVVRTMETAGRAVVFSGAPSRSASALLLFVPVPFVRSLGVGGFLVPLVSIAAAPTLQPALLSVLGVRGMRRSSCCRPRATRPRLLGAARARDHAPPAALPRRRRRVLVAAASPPPGSQVTPGSISALPRGNDSVARPRAAPRPRRRRRADADEIVVDTGRRGGVRTPQLQRAVARLANATFHDPEAYIVASGRRAPYVDATGRYARVFVVGRHEYGAEQRRQLVRRIRSD